MLAEKRSLPTRGAWIEIKKGSVGLPKIGQSLPTRGAWIEITLLAELDNPPPSLPTRGAWIEIKVYTERAGAAVVAPHTGSVD